MLEQIDDRTWNTLRGLVLACLAIGLVSGLGSHFGQIPILGYVCWTSFALLGIFFGGLILLVGGYLILSEISYLSWRLYARRRYRRRNLAEVAGIGGGIFWFFCSSTIDQSGFIPFLLLGAGIAAIVSLVWLTDFLPLKRRRR
jgi:hypothetical protein